MGVTTDLDLFLTLHKDQLISSGVPEIYWTTLNEKIHHQTFDAGETFQLLQISYDEERQPHEPAWALQAINDIKKSDPKHLYLIDHAWTFQVRHAKNQLLQFDTLRSRLCNMLDLDQTLPKEKITEHIFENVWKICRTYSIGNAPNIEDRLPVWYVMDEIGSAVMHSDTPNCRVVPFVHCNAQVTYSLLFPIKDIAREDFIFADFAEGLHDVNERAAALLPWVPHSFQGMDFKPEMPGADYYLSGHIEETLPNASKRPECEGRVKFDIRYMILVQSVKPLKVYIYKNFFVRFANKPFAMKDFEDYEMHFTVMNYDENVVMKHMLCSEFKIQWSAQYPEQSWDNVEKSVLDTLRNAMKCAAKDGPPCGIAHNPQSRAMYAADLMLEWDDDKIQPKLLEINWAPDCKRACEYYPDFYNDVFRCLFLNESLEHFIEL